jgi:hypothetical protein
MKVRDHALFILIVYYLAQCCYKTGDKMHFRPYNCILGFGEVKVCKYIAIHFTTHSAFISLSLKGKW